MRAVVFTPTTRPSRTATALHRALRRQAPVPFRVVDVPTPVPHAPGWVVVHPALSGICSADLNLLRSTPEDSVITAYRSHSPVIPGHEVVGVVESAYKTKWASEGRRVIMEPTLACVHKGLPTCRRCRAGAAHLCENVDRSGPLCSGKGVGFSPDTGGGWSDAFLVHEDMLLPADGISDQRGVLAEPTATALHGALRWRDRGERVVVIGSGSLSRLVIATLTRLHPGIDITVMHDGRLRQRHRWTRPRRAVPAHLAPDPEAQAEDIKRFGAARVWRASPAQLIEDAASLLGARMLRSPASDLPVLDRGVDAVFDCRCTAASIDLGLRLLRAGGTMVTMGTAAGIQPLDWSLAWWRELTIHASATYGRETNGHRTFAIVREWLTDPSFDIEGLITHRFPLEQVDKAVATSTAGPTIGAVKVVIEGAAAYLRDRPTHESQAQADDSDAPLLLSSVAERTRSKENSDQSDSELP